MRRRRSLAVHNGITSDGCSGGLSWIWRLFTGRRPPFICCCVAHDYAYAAGGGREDRRRADARLRTCVAGRGYPRLAWLMWAAVRLYGWIFWGRP